MKTNRLWFGLGICVGIILSVGAAYVLGPRGSSTYMNLYDGALWSENNWLWHTWRSEHPLDEPTKWARAHAITNRTTYWPAFCSSRQKKWFWGTVFADGATPNIVYGIYFLSVPENDKIAMLHELHQDLDLMRDVDRSHPSLKLVNKWEAKLQRTP